MGPVKRIVRPWKKHMFIQVLVSRKMLRLTDHQRSETLGLLRTGRGIVALAHYCTAIKPQQFV